MSLKPIIWRIKQVLNPLLKSRRLRSYGTGLGKSGTHSLSDLLGQTLRSAHEPHDKDLIEAILQREAGTLTGEAFRRYLKRRDRQLWLEADVSTLNLHIMEEVMELYPDSKVILMVRDPISWLNSSWNQLGARHIPEWYAKLDAWKYGPRQHEYAKYENVLSTYNLPSAESHLQLWGSIYNELPGKVGEDRLTVVRIHELNTDLPEICRFLGVSEVQAPAKAVHSYRAKADLGLIHGLDVQWLNELVEAHCEPALSRLYPEAKTLETAIEVGYLKPGHA
jgi:hypothetical protein